MTCPARQHFAHMADLRAFEEELGERKRQERAQRLLDIEAEGERAGVLGNRVSANDYHGDELAVYVRGFVRGGARRGVNDLKRTRRSCIGCTCGGKGQCVGDTA